MNTGTRPSLKSATRTKLILHIVVGILLLPTIICGIVRIVGTNGSRGQSTNVIGMSLKSYTFLTYIVLTERYPRFQKWASKKAYAIINCCEIVFWIVVFGLSASGASRSCPGSQCAVSVVLILLSITLTSVFTFASYIYIRDYRQLKRTGIETSPVTMVEKVAPV